jgi:O-antigen/teichoic acid export membrane protein
MPQQLNQRLDQVFMAMYLPSESLGIYVVSVAWSNAFTPVLSSVSQVLFPRLAANHDYKVQLETLCRTLRMTVLITLIVSAMLIVLTPYLLPLVFGIAFLAAIPATFILIVAINISTINQALSDGLRGIGEPKLPMISEFVGLATTIGMLGLLLRRYELMGAAISSLASYSVSLALLVFLMTKKTNLSPWILLVPRREDFLLLVSQVIKLRQLFKLG